LTRLANAAAGDCNHVNEQLPDSRTLAGQYPFGRASPDACCALNGSVSCFPQGCFIDSYHTPAKVDREIQPRALSGSRTSIIGIEFAHAFGNSQIKFQRFFEANFDVENFSVGRKSVEGRTRANKAADAKRLLGWYFHNLYYEFARDIKQARDSFHLSAILN
jgi:hypothetical protein